MIWRGRSLWSERNWHILVGSFQLEFSAEQIEGKFVITAVACVARAFYRIKECVMLPISV